VVGEVSETLVLSTIDPRSIGEGGGVGACRNKGGGLKDGVRFSRLISNGGFATCLGSRGSVSEGRTPVEPVEVEVGPEQAVILRFERPELAASWSVIA